MPPTLRPRRPTLATGACALGAGVVALATMGGCVVPLASTRVPSPFNYGVVAVNRVVHHESRRAAELGIPTSAVGLEASLVALTPNRACFVFVTRVEGQRADQSDPQRWRLVLTGEPALRASGPLFLADARVGERVYRSELPLDERRRFDQSCSGVFTTSGQLAPCTPVRREENDDPLPPVTVWSTSQSVCFAIEPAIGVSTRRLTLTATAPDGDADSRRAFEWVLER